MTATAKILKMTRWVSACLFMVLAFATIGQAQEGSVIPGQFQVGDRIALTVEGPVSFADTVVVREGLYFVLPNAGNISVRGVARADAQKYLTEQVRKYMRDVTVRTTVLIRVGVFGAVARPGYYSIPTDILFGDIPKAAGGLNGNADPNKIVVKRQDKVVIGEKETQQALFAGKTVDDVRVVTNDVIWIGDRPQRNLSQYLQVIGVVLGIVGLAFSLKNR